MAHMTTCLHWTVKSCLGPELGLLELFFSLFQMSLFIVKKNFVESLHSFLQTEFIVQSMWS